jgi:threonine/homoserine/homoserine lactone efflux protein
MNFAEGYLLGLGMIIFIGPVFFLLLSSTLKCGFMPGFMVALGIIISDIVCVLVCKYGLAPYLRYPESNFWIALAGGILLIGIGIKYMRADKMEHEEKIVLPKHYYIAFFIKGFLINFVNPFVFMVWLGLIKYAEQKTEINTAVFLISVLLGIFTTDFLKVVLAKQIKRYIQPSILQWIYRIFGFILIVFGLRMICLFLF